MNRTFTKYPTNYVKASTEYSNVLFEVRHTDSSGREFRGQLYTADQVSKRLMDILSQGGTNITVNEFRTKR